MKPSQRAAGQRSISPSLDAVEHDGSDPCGCGGPPTEPGDAELVAGCLRGDATCWEALVRRYQRLVFAIVRRAGMDEHMAADVFQTVFSRLLSQLPRISDPARLQAWIVTTAKREALLQRRRGERTISMTGDSAHEEGRAAEWDVADTAPLAEDALEQLQQLDLVRRGLERLDPRCRQLIEMLFSDEDTQIGYAELAAKLNMAVGSIGATRARCLEKLRNLLS
jgi:RNA polymerase sigma factor (sigma-70 family)